MINGDMQFTVEHFTKYSFISDYDDKQNIKSKNIIPIVDNELDLKTTDFIYSIDQPKPQRPLEYNEANESDSKKSLSITNKDSSIENYDKQSKPENLHSIHQNLPEIPKLKDMEVDKSFEDISAQTPMDQSKIFSDDKNDEYFAPILKNDDLIVSSFDNGTEFANSSKSRTDYSIKMYRAFRTS